jgi:hypothetical protein
VKEVVLHTISYNDIKTTKIQIKWWAYSRDQIDLRKTAKGEFVEGITRKPPLPTHKNGILPWQV